MDWPNERYVRVYTRDTTTWLMLTWQGRAVLPLLMRKVDRAGVLDLGVEDDPAEAVAVMVLLPLDVVREGLLSLVDRKVIEVRPTSIVLPNFLEAQEAMQSAAQRQRESRAKRRAKARAGIETTTRQRTGPDKTTNGFVYFIQAPAGEVKIGSAVDVHKRLMSLRGSSPVGLTLIATIEDGRREAELHELFGGDRLHGEWFWPSQAMAEWIDTNATCHSDLRSVTERDTLTHSESKPSLQPSLAQPTQPIPCRAVDAHPRDATPAPTLSGMDPKAVAMAEELRRDPHLAGVIIDPDKTAEKLLGVAPINAEPAWLVDAIQQASAELGTSASEGAIRRKLRIFVGRARKPDGDGPDGGGDELKVRPPILPKVGPKRQAKLDALRKSHGDKTKAKASA